MPDPAFGSIFATPETFIKTVFRDLIGREPDEAGMKFYLDALQNGLSRLDVIKNILLSDEYQARERSDNEFLQDLYLAVLKRRTPPDEGSAAEWIEFLRTEGRAEAVERFLSGSEVVELYETATGPLTPLEQYMLDQLQEIAAGVADVKEYARKRLMTTDLTSEILCLIDLKHQQLEKTVDGLLQDLESRLARLESSPAAIAGGHSGGPEEALVEIPFCLDQLSALPRASRMIHLGCGDGLLPLILAGMGHAVYAVDFPASPLPPPALRAVPGPVALWEGPEEKVDAVVCNLAAGPAAETMSRLRGWLKPSGILVFTAPCAGHITDLLAGWTIVDRRYYQGSPGQYWKPVSAAPEQACPGVKTLILVAARC